MWDVICSRRLLRWIALAALIYRIVTIISVALSKSVVPDEASEAYFQLSFLPIRSDKGTDDTNNTSNFILMNSSGSEYFGGRQLIVSEEPPTSSVHCLAETFNETRINTPGALYRSCRYYNMCYHINQNRLVLFPSAQHWTLLSTLHHNIFLSTVSKAVMTSAVLQATPELTPSVTPQYLHHTNDNRYYYFANENDTVWIPIEPVSCESVLWDVYLPIYTLLETFQLVDKSWRLLVLGESPSCTRQHLEEYVDMMGLSTRDIVYLGASGPTTVPNPYQDFVCYSHSVMGIGAFADHRVIRPTQHLKDQDRKHIPPNHMRRAVNLRAFRQHCLGNLSILPRRSTPYTVAFSSSLLVEYFSFWSIPGIQIVELSPMDQLRTQMQTTSKAAILILASHEDKTAALFLPEGATLILVGEAQEDWDLWTNNALVRLHLVRSRIKETVEYLILDELSRLEQQETSFTMTDNVHQVEFVNNRSVTLVHANPPITRVHCVGEKLFPDVLGAEQYRSCHFENLCFDLKSKSFVMFPSPLIQDLVHSNGSLLDENNYVSSIPRSLIASPQPSYIGAGYFSDLPRVHNRSNISSYYQFEGTWLATRTFNTNNIGHMLWDVWLPIYTMLEMFGLTEDRLLVTRYPSKTDAARTNKGLERLFGFATRIAKNELLVLPDAESSYVCATHGASGFGWLTDHGASNHGWDPPDLEYPVNIGRGPELRRLRQYMLKNTHFVADTKLEAPYRVTFSINSSRNLKRRIDFRDEIAAVATLSNIEMDGGLHLAELSIPEQIAIASKTAIYISVVGGGTFPAFFLPQGASLILYGDKDMYLDFDLFNNYGQVRVHWMSLTSRKNDTGILLNLIRDELEAIARSHI